ncbi:MAG: cell wall metabolism sensor histidine kinase WalK [Ruminiclostridium sp.]|nr:cell wall metabolism sensor histidine kinase WalK [Ruminiclostridium sp.]
MFKTIFSKLVAIFSIILIIAFTIAGTTLSLILDRNLTDQKANALEAGCDSINQVFTKYLEFKGNIMGEVYLNYSLEAYYYAYANSMVWIVDKSGHIIKSSPDMDLVFQRYEDSTGLIKLPEARQYAKVMSGPGVVREVGDFYGFFKDAVFKKNKNVSWLTVEKSFTGYKDKKGNDTLVAVYMHIPVPEVQKARIAIFSYFLISVGVAVFISVILIYIFSLRFTRPLKQIKNAAKIISGGEFGKRLDIRSNDEIGELAKTFNNMAAALQNLEEMRRGFIANVSHELRTPMTSIRGFIQGILDGTIPEEKQSYYLTVVSDETNRLNRLVNNLLDLAKMEAGEVKMSFKPFDINELVRRSVIKFETLLLEKSIMVEADFEEEIMGVNADIDAIDRVIYNLLHNAIKFTSEGGKITISVKSQKDRIQVSVADTGSGIESSELDMIWERFYKSDKSRSRDKTGTGLGLAIVKNIMNEHGQDIWVESEPGKGAIFTFTLARSDKLKEPVE